MTKAERIEKQKEDLQTMLEFERKLWDAGKYYVAGVDEVGRGPLAGPVVTAAVILPHDFSLLGVNDSKKLSPKQRDYLFDQIKEAAVAWSLGRREPERIDEINILEATKEAMIDAINGLDIKPDHVLIDAVTLKNLQYPQTAIIKGDAKSASIAAASILAKVTRDRMMVEYDKIYPEYGFAKHKGYGTAAHIEALGKYGPTPIHRMSFIQKFIHV